MKTKGQKNEVKKTTKLSAQYKKYAKYKWEFLRRNKKYIQEWGKIEDLLNSKHGKWRPPSGILIPEETAFCMKWRIAAPLSPNVSYDAWTPDLEDPALPINTHAIMFSILFPEILNKKPISIIDRWKSDKDDFVIDSARRSVAESGTLKVEIDLNYSKQRLLKDFTELLNDWKPACTSQSLKKTKKYEKKYHFDNFDVYLKVYDLRKKRKTWSTIQKDLGLNSIQTARNHYQSALKIIDEGINLYVK